MGAQDTLTRTARAIEDEQNKYYEDALAWETTLIQHCTTLVKAKKRRREASSG